jgi:hypothetical protein
MVRAAIGDLLYVFRFVATQEPDHSESDDMVQTGRQCAKDNTCHTISFELRLPFHSGCCATKDDTYVSQSA